MGKSFQHRKCKFYILPHATDWKGKTRKAYHVHDVLAHSVPVHTIYDEKDDELWQITKEDLFNNRQLYQTKPGAPYRYHIDLEFLTQIPITDEQRKDINNYEFKEGKEDKEVSKDNA